MSFRCSCFGVPSTMGPLVVQFAVIGSFPKLLKQLGLGKAQASGEEVGRGFPGGWQAPAAFQGVLTVSWSWGWELELGFEPSYSSVGRKHLNQHSLRWSPKPAPALVGWWS